MTLSDHALAAEAWTPNLTWITDHLAIGGRFPGERTAHLAEALRVRAVIDMRSEDCDDEAALAQHGIAFLHLPTDDNAALTLAVLDRGVAFVRQQADRGRRTLIHCEHGIGRSATLALAVLVSEGRTPLDALNLAKDARERVSPSPAQYGCWRDWLAARKAAESHAWEVPGFDAFAAVAYRHLAPPR